MLRKILQYALGLIFIASGLAKAVDPVGFSFKLEEYFSPTVLNLPFLESASLPLAVAISALEVLLGVFLFSGRQLKRTLNVLIALCVFFAFLTFYSAYFNKVTDCGCFGDVLKLTPWTSFIKDIILLIGLLLLRWWEGKRQDQHSKRPNLSIEIIGVAILAIFLFRGLTNEPLIDFRDYKIGTDLALERKKAAANPEVYSLIYHLKNQKTQQEITVDQQDFVHRQELWQPGTNWEIQSEKTETQITSPGYETEVRKLQIADSHGRDITDSLLAAPQAILLLSYNPAKVSDAEKNEAYNKLPNPSKAIAISSKVGTFPGMKNAFADPTVIKTIARSNPAVVVLQHGKVISKKPL